MQILQCENRRYIGQLVTECESQIVQLAQVLDSIHALQGLVPKVQEMQTGELFEIVHALHNSAAARDLSFFSGVKVMDRQFRTIAVSPVFPYSFILIRIKQDVSGQREAFNSPQQRIRQSLQLVQAKKCESGVVQLPAALRILYVILIEISRLNQIFCLLLKFRRDSYKGPVEPLYGLEVLKTFDSHKLKAYRLGIVHFVQKIQVFYSRDTVQKKCTCPEIYFLRQHVSAGDLQRTQVHSFHRAKISQTGAIVDLKDPALFAESVRTFKSLQGSERLTVG